jgi:hypothetical protein
MCIILDNVTIVELTLVAATLLSGSCIAILMIQEEGLLLEGLVRTFGERGRVAMKPARQLRTLGRLGGSRNERYGLTSLRGFRSRHLPAADSHTDCVGGQKSILGPDAAFLGISRNSSTQGYSFRSTAFGEKGGQAEDKRKRGIQRTNFRVSLGWLRLLATSPAFILGIVEVQ